MILLIYVTHNNEFNSLKKFVLDMLKSGAIAQLGEGGDWFCLGRFKKTFKI
jgi:hypothetical protein